MSEKEVKATQENLYSKDLFKDEMQMIETELGEIDNLYGEIKTHFDNIKNSQARGSLSFIKDQTANLISLKKAKLDYIGKKADLKRTITDYAFKEKASNKQDSQVDEITEAIYKKISSEFRYVPDKDIPNELSNDDIESVLDEELDNEDIGNIIINSTSVENVSVDYEINTDEAEDEEDVIIPDNSINEDEEKEPDKTVAAVDLSTNLFYEIDLESFSIVEELGALEKIVDQIEIEEDSYAVGESGKAYLVIDLEDE